MEKALYYYQQSFGIDETAGYQQGMARALILMYIFCYSGCAKLDKLDANDHKQTVQKRTTYSAVQRLTSHSFVRSDFAL